MVLLARSTTQHSVVNRRQGWLFTSWFPLIFIPTMVGKSKGRVRTVGACGVCGAALHDTRHAADHRQLHVWSRVRCHKCPECKSYFKRLCDVTKHQNDRHGREIGRTMVQCDVCKREIRPYNLGGHKRRHHPELVSSRLNASEDSGNHSADSVEDNGGEEKSDRWDADDGAIEYVPFWSGHSTPDSQSSSSSMCESSPNVSDWDEEVEDAVSDVVSDATLPLGTAGKDGPDSPIGNVENVSPVPSSTSVPEEYGDPYDQTPGFSSPEQCQTDSSGDDDVRNDQVDWVEDGEDVIDIGDGVSGDLLLPPDMNCQYRKIMIGCIDEDPLIREENLCLIDDPIKVIDMVPDLQRFFHEAILMHSGEVEVMKRVVVLILRLLKNREARQHTTSKMVNICRLYVNVVVRDAVCKCAQPLGNVLEPIQHVEFQRHMELRKLAAEAVKGMVSLVADSENHLLGTVRRTYLSKVLEPRRSVEGTVGALIGLSVLFQCMDIKQNISKIVEIIHNNWKRTLHPQCEPYIQEFVWYAIKPAFYPTLFSRLSAEGFDSKFGYLGAFIRDRFEDELA